MHWVELKPTAEGATLVLPNSGTGFLVAAFAGYLGPSAVGLAAARFIQFGHVIAVLWVLMLLLGLLLIKLKPSFGFLTVPVAGIVIFVLLDAHAPDAEILAAYVITWFLLLSGVRIVLQRGVQAGDAGLLRDQTSIPRAGGVAVSAGWYPSPA